MKDEETDIMEPIQTSDIKNWFLNLISLFREKYEKLDELEKAQISNIVDYTAPCQIEVFWMNEPLEHQIILLTHFADRKDMELIINGPYKGYEFLDEIEKIMNEPRWEKSVPSDLYYQPDGKTVKYSDIFAGILSPFLNSIRSSVFLKNTNDYRFGFGFLQNAWCECALGNVCRLDYNLLSENAINEAKLRAKEIRERPTEEPAKVQAAPKLNGYGTYFYPPIWVGKIPEPTFRQKVGRVQFPFPSKVFDLTFDGKKLVVDSDGFVGIESESKEYALRVLNTIFGMALVFDNKCFAAREQEMADITIDASLSNISSTSISISSPRTQLMNWGHAYETIMSKKVEIPEEKIKQFIENAEKIIKDEDLTEQVLFLLEGYTHHSNSEYSQAFIINWLIVEIDLFRRWTELLKELGIRGERKNKLTDTRQWEADYVLEALSIKGEINDEEYALLSELKTKRNHFVHKRELIDEQTSEKLLNLGFTIVKNNLAQALDSGMI